MLDETGEFHASIKSRRFDRVLSKNGSTSTASPSDTVVYRDESFVVCPTLGSFLPFWYLILPVEHHLSFSDWAAQREQRSVASAVASIVRNLWGREEEFIWFEHGPTSAGSITGCGVDHAHVHVLLKSNISTENLLHGALAFGVTGWNEANFAEIYDTRLKNREYLAFGNSIHGYLKNLSEPVGSQFFRRVLAFLCNDRDDWDYRTHAHQDIARQSVEGLAGKKHLQSAL
jgi:ATP adenylyltransferase